VQFAKHLAAHAQEEEEFTYPTALLIGSNYSPLCGSVTHA
jgi:hypothetical protein